MPRSKYEKRGVSATKSEVHQAIKGLDKGLYPNAFCKILPDIVAHDPLYCNIMHADTAGTKTSLAYLYWKYTGDVSVWEGIVKDSIYMNLDDMACVGCTSDIVLSSTIGRNKNLITKEVVATIINFAPKLKEMLAKYDINIHLSGGETADVGDIVRTIDVGYTAFSRLKKSDLIINNIQDGDVIVGIASYGQSTYETEYNSGIGSNGLTGARHDVLASNYAVEFPDSFDGNISPEMVYTGIYQLNDKIKIGKEKHTIGKLLLSPTRTFLPLVKRLLKDHRHIINGLIHCTGGGQAKVLNFIDRKRIIKDNLLPIPPIFSLVQQSSQTDWKEMYQVFNMGQRLNVYLPEKYASEVISIANSFNIDAQVIGRVEEAEKNEVVIHHEKEKFLYH